MTGSKHLTKLKLLSGAQGLQWSVSITSGPRKENSDPVTGSWGSRLTDACREQSVASVVQSKTQATLPQCAKQFNAGFGVKVSKYREHHSLFCTGQCNGHMSLRRANGRSRAGAMFP